MTHFLPLKVVSESNAHQHWRARQRRAKSQRTAVRFCLWNHLRGRGKPARVTLTRVEARRLDSDNLAGAFKHVRDELASLMGFDDRDEAVAWEYRQRKPERECGIEVAIEWSTSCPTTT